MKAFSISAISSVGLTAASPKKDHLAPVTDAAGNLPTKTARRGQTTGQAYDNLDRLRRKRHPDASEVT